MADKALDEDKIGVLVDRRVTECIGMGNTRLSKEREKVNLYYNSEGPKPQHRGQASYVSTDVYDAVEAMKAQLLETFAGGNEIIKFAPQGPEDVEPSRIATEYASYVLFQQNDGFGIFHDTIDDGLKARIGIVKVYWDERKEYNDETFEHIPEEDVTALAGQEDIESLEAELDPSTNGYTGKLTRIKSVTSQVVIENVAPEEFGIEPQAKRLEGAFHYHRTLLTKGQIKAMGLDVKKLYGVAPDADVISDLDQEKDARFSQLDSGYRSDDDVPEEMRRYKVYECYMELAPEPNDRPRLYKIVRCCNKTLAMDEVDRSPFKVFTPLRVAHSFYGQNFANRVIPTQNARTVLTRGILDHTSITNNPRYTVLQGGLTNPREMLDNRLGGLVNITRPDAVQPLNQASLNPFVYQTLEMLKAANEETTGISSLSQGLNKDAISSQNSQGMVNDLVSLSQTRQKVIARNFASFLTELYIEIYRLVLENENRQSIIEVAGNWMEIDPRTWVERKDAQVSMHLGNGELDAEAMKFTGLLAMAVQDPMLGEMIGAKERYNAAVTVMKLKKIKNVNDFIMPPEKIPPKQPDPMLMKKMELEERTVATAEKTAEAHLIKAQADVQKKQLEMTLAQMKADLEDFIKRSDDHRKNMDVANKIDVAQRELEVAEAAPAVEPAKAIISPNS